MSMIALLLCESKAKLRVSANNNDIIQIKCTWLYVCKLLTYFPKSTQSMVLSTQSMVLPTQSMVLPTQSMVLSTQSMVLPTQSMVLSTQSMVLPTQSMVLSTMNTMASTGCVTDQSFLCTINSWLLYYPYNNYRYIRRYVCRLSIAVIFMACFLPDHRTISRYCPNHRVISDLSPYKFL